MKQIIKENVKKMSNRAAMVCAMIMFSVIAFAQEKKVDIDINTKSDDGNFLTQYWVWIVVGAAVFILLLIALLRNNSSKN